MIELLLNLSFLRAIGSTNVISKITIAYSSQFATLLYRNTRVLLQSCCLRLVIRHRTSSHKWRYCVKQYFLPIMGCIRCLMHVLLLNWLIRLSSRWMPLFGGTSSIWVVFCPRCNSLIRLIFHTTSDIILSSRNSHQILCRGSNLLWVSFLRIFKTLSKM